MILSINGYDWGIGLGKRELRGQEPTPGSQRSFLLDMFLQQQNLRKSEGGSLKEERRSHLAEAET
jgi:hypothetical protein